MAIQQDMSPVVVQPFMHQVGGHTAVVTVPGSPFVAKPVDPKRREHDFYQHTPVPIRKFVPKFHGVQSARFSPNATAGGPAADEQPTADADRSGPAVALGLPGAPPCGPGPEVMDKPSEATAAAASSQASSHANPWSQRMYQKALEKSSGHGGCTDVILLENLAAKFSQPCIMDIKIGKRSYADDATESKRARSEAKARSTTSHSLGFRLCGMQVYSPTEGRFLRQDKYYGRMLTPETVPDALGTFFGLHGDTPPSPEHVVRSHAIVAALADRLDELRTALASLTGVRFYSSSVLLMYEGNPAAGEGTASPASLVDLRIIDFANTTLSVERPDDGNAAGPDESFIFGLTTLGQMLRALPAASQGAADTVAGAGAA